jgi:hypothetical protein
MISPKELLQTSVYYAHALRDVIPQCIRLDRTPEDVPTTLERACDDLMRETGRPVADVVDFFSPTIVVILLRGRYHRGADADFTRQNFESIEFIDTNYYWQLIADMIYQGDFDPRILTVIDALIEFLRNTNVRLILAGPGDDDEDLDRRQGPIRRFYPVFLQAYDSKLLLELPEEDLQYFAETRRKILG